MRVALFSDIHGNVRGLDACLADLEAQGGADVLVGAGDFCMDGPRPRDVLERLHSVGAQCLRGNTDRYIGDTHIYDDDEAEALAWQRSALGARWVGWLRDLPPSLTFGDGPDALLAVHANPKQDDVHIWPDADDDFLESITRDVAQRTIAFGHLHLPYARMWRDRLFVCVASAGLPKDGDPRASYAILTQRSGGWEVKHRRVAFDVEAVVKDIRASGMPKPAKRIKVLRRARYKELTHAIP
jgi:predicted phosphodiesterase